MSTWSEQEARRREAMVRLVMAVVSLAVMCWYLIPDHQRRLMLMRLAEGSRRRLAAAAWSSGRLAMRTELVTGREEYGLPYLLSCARDRAAKVYDRLRDVAV